MRGLVVFNICIATKLATIKLKRFAYCMQGLLKDGADGSKHWAYGGDFGDFPDDLNFCLNGITWPDRTPHPAMHGNLMIFFFFFLLMSATMKY